MEFFFLWLAAAILFIQSVRTMFIPFERNLPWHKTAILVVLGGGLAVFSWLICVLSVSAIVDEVK